HRPRAGRRRVRPATGPGRERGLRRPVRPGDRRIVCRAGGRADGAGRADDRHQRVQQRPEGEPGRVPVPVSQGGIRVTTGLKGKVALTTGAAHGQGRAAALALAREGAHVAALDVARQLEYPGYALATPAELESLAAEARRLGVTCLPLVADVRDGAAVTRAV